VSREPRSPSFELEAPDHFTTGARGRPGQRVFYVQARQDGTTVTLKAEKEQVGALGEYLSGLLARLAPAPAEPAAEVALLEPVVEAWAVGSVGVGYNEERDRIVIVLDELLEEAEEDEAKDADEDVGGGEAASARFHITRPQAAAFVERARALLKAGRPICPTCRRPKDAEGHFCPESNGHRAG
jgi:uncharacterized repeat protein (TIGR03847 family)